MSQMLPKEPSFMDLKKQCKILVAQGHKGMVGYSKMNKSEMIQKLNEFVLNGTAQVPKDNTTVTESFKETYGTPPPEAPAKTKRPLTVWNRYCKERNLPCGSKLTPEQREDYEKYKIEDRKDPSSRKA